MEIPRDANAAVVVTHNWANLTSVRMLLRDNPSEEIGRSDDSHLVFCKILDGTNPYGIWIELRSEKKPGDSRARGALLIPWSAVLTVSLSETFSPELWRTKNSSVEF
jgi:hypothetical protein